MENSSINIELFAERLKIAREKSGLSLDEAAIRSGCTKGTLWKYEKALRVPKLPIAKNLANTLNVSFDWLTGYSNVMEPDSPKIVDVYNKLSYAGKQQVYDFATFIYNRENCSQEETATSEFPLLGKTAAGSGIINGEYKELIQLNHIPKGADFALKVVGDSMEPLIKDGSIIFVKKQEYVENGEIAVIDIDGETICKKVYINDEGFELRSINKNYKPIYTKNAKIIGKVSL